jgi:hypothetical protein
MYDPHHAWHPCALRLLLNASDLLVHKVSYLEFMAIHVITCLEFLKAENDLIFSIPEILFNPVSLVHAMHIGIRDLLKPTK